MSTLGYALRIIHEGERKANLAGNDCFICQLTNDNLGFKSDVIEAVIERVEGMTFDIPTHISILPKGLRPSSVTLFDGLQDIYCNSDDLKRIVNEMKKEVMK